MDLLLENGVVQTEIQPELLMLQRWQGCSNCAWSFKSPGPVATGCRRAALICLGQLAAELQFAIESAWVRKWVIQVGRRIENVKDRTLPLLGARVTRR